MAGDGKPCRADEVKKWQMNPYRVCQIVDGLSDELHNNVSE